MHAAHSKVMEDAVQTQFYPQLLHPGDIKKAKEAGYHTIMSFVMNPSKVYLNPSALERSRFKQSSGTRNVCKHVASSVLNIYFTHEFCRDDHEDGIYLISRGGRSMILDWLWS